MWCAGCEADYPAGARFCEECGTWLGQRCPACGHLGSSTAKFCAGCGGRLQEAGPPVQAAPASQGAAGPSPRSYTPRYLAEKILASRAGLEGERKQVTVLFADIKGSTELIAGLDAEVAQRLLDGAIRVMMDAVHRYEGTVSRLMGDGLMALFGAPLAHEDHAVRACYAALALQEGIRRYAEAVFAEHALRIEARVGLNSGEVVVRLISDDLHMDYTAMGPTVHLASRMEQLAREGTSLLAPETLTLVEGYVQVASLGHAPIKGLAAPVEVFELQGVGAARTRLQASAARGLSRFVGREDELCLMYGALDRARAGHGQLVALVGEPGVGKSRLVRELTHSHRTRGWLVLESSSVSYGKATSYLPVIDLLKSYCRIEARDDARTVREKLAGKVLMLDRALEPSLPALLALVDALPPVPAGRAGGAGGAGGEVSPWMTLDPAQRRRQTLDAVKALLLRESQEQPLLLVFEDLHWVDNETQALLDSLVESLPTTRLLLLVNYRPEYRPTWDGSPACTELRIDPLPPESADALLGPLLGESPDLQPLRQLLIERTGGNPFFLEESIRSLVESGTLDGERGAYRLAGAVAEARVPATVQAILAARIDRLAPWEKRLLQAAAVVGKDVPLPLLEAVAELPDEQLRRGLASLQAAEFLYERSIFPELELTFKHALTHEVTYGSLLHERRRALHARIVEAIEATAGDRLAGQVDRLAHHAVRGEVWATALTYLRQAYARVMAHSAQREAVGYADQALAALAHLPDRPEKSRQSIDLRFQLRHALWALGEMGRIRQVLEAAEALAVALGDDDRRGWAGLYMCGWLYGAAEHDRAIEVGQQTVALATALGDETLGVLALVNLAQAHAARTDYRDAVELASRAVDRLGGELLYDRLGQGTVPSVLARVNLVRGLVELGRFEEASVMAEEAVRIAEEVGHPGSLALACKFAGLPHLRRGNPARAIPLFERGMRLCAELGLPTYTHWIGPALGLAYARAGRADDGIALLEQAIEEGAAASLFSQHSLTVIYLAEALLLAGREEEARTRALEGLDLAGRRHERGYEARALWLLGRIEIGRSGTTGPATARLREALALAEALGMRPLAADCQAALARLTSAPAGCGPG